jgi:hypothetical protein
MRSWHGVLAGWLLAGFVGGCGATDSNGAGAAGSGGKADMGDAAGSAGANSAGENNTGAGKGGTSGSSGGVSGGGAVGHAGTSSNGGSATGGQGGAASAGAAGGPTGGGGAGGTGSGGLESFVGSPECTAYCSKLSTTCPNAKCDPDFTCRVFEWFHCAAEAKANLLCAVDTGTWTCGAGDTYSVNNTCPHQPELCQ